MGMALPPDRGQVRTERRHDASMTLDALEVEACVDLLVNDYRSVADAVSAARCELARFIEKLVERLRAGGRLVYVGAGTSGRLGVLDAAECPPTFRSDPAQIVGIIAGGDACLRQSAEAREDDPDGAAAELSKLALRSHDTVMGIAAGGTTPYVLGALRLARRAGAATALLTCARPASAPEACGDLIVLDTGAELLTGSTRLKAGSATKLALNVITTTVFIRLGKVYSNLMVDVRATNAKLADRAIRILRELCPALSRAEAAQTLERAGSDLKTAIVMQRLGVDAQRAQTLLTEHAGRLRSILDPPAVSSPAR